MRRLLPALTLGAALVAVLPAPPALAAATTADGQRCTQVGTPGPDVLRGTSGRDVLCGLGGNDVLYGLGGDDVLDGGAGADRLVGAGGDDKLSGGPGGDRLEGGDGDDRSFGGSGADVIRSGGGADTVSGGTGDDIVDGGPGADRAYGGDGDDDIEGGSGNDLILGQDDDDALDGGDGRDTVDGGGGRNMCTEDAADKVTYCIYDQAAPVVVWASVTRERVDVTEADARLTVRARLRDDTGVLGPQAGFFPDDGIQTGVARLVSGTVRDGVWEIPVTVARHTPPGAVDVGVYTFDHLWRMGQRSYADALTVRDADPDLAMPVVEALKASPASVDVRTAAHGLTVTVHITDDEVGVQDGSACLVGPLGDVETCEDLALAVGTRRDGTWKATFTVPRAAPTGTWALRVFVADSIHHGSQFKEVPLDVQGGPPATPDVTAPALDSVKVNKTSIDTKDGAQTVSLYVHAVDAAGEGVERTGVYIRSVPGVDEVLLGGQSAKPYQDTRVNGWWKVTVTFPQGTPPGRYFLSDAYLSDAAHSVTYVLPDSPYLAGDPGLQVLPWSALTTTAGAAWDGIVTVVAPAD